MVVRGGSRCVRVVVWCVWVRLCVCRVAACGVCGRSVVRCGDAVCCCVCGLICVECVSVGVVSVVE